MRVNALTVWQPWASLIIIGAKPFEFRGGHTAKEAKRYVGQRIVIHAGARPIKQSEVMEMVARIKFGESALIEEIAMPLLDRLLAQPKCGGVLELSAGLGSVVMGEPKSVLDLFGGKGHDSERLNHHLFGLPMLDVRPFEHPIPCRGFQGFWKWPADLAVGP